MSVELTQNLVSAISASQQPVLQEVDNTVVAFKQFMADIRGVFEAQAQEISSLKANAVKIEEEKKTQEAAFAQLFSTLQGQFTEQSAQISQLQSQVTTLTSQLQTLQASYSQHKHSIYVHRQCTQITSTPQ